MICNIARKYLSLHCVFHIRFMANKIGTAFCAVPILLEVFSLPLILWIEFVVVYATWTEFDVVEWEGTVR